MKILTNWSKQFTALFFLSLFALITSCGSEGNSSSDVTMEPFLGAEIEKFVSFDKDKFPSYNANYPPPAGAPEIFSLSQDYPDKPTSENNPWLATDFEKEPMKYMETVLDYCIEGNKEVSFKGQDNPVRKWYHSPWLHDDGKYSSNHKYVGNGREYIHGLTRERSTPKFEMHPKQDTPLENWAVGMYNAPGGSVLGKVWDLENAQPETELANFPEGTVAFKLLFTDGEVSKLPFLENSMEWTANIYPGDPAKAINQKRVNRTVRLVQIDIAVKDKRSSGTGWVFGTFIYDAASPGESVWERMVPVGLSWGDDKGVVTDLHKEGAFVNTDLKESFINASLLGPKKNERAAYMTHHGLGGRMNGPVDNPISSCTSCHGQAGVNNQGVPMSMGDFGATRANYPMSSFNLYFSIIKPGSYTRIFNGSSYTTVDYSLQLSAGIRNFYNNEKIKNELVATSQKQNRNIKKLTPKDVISAARRIKPLPDVTRGE